MERPAQGRLAISFPTPTGPPSGPTLVEYVGGPRHGQREMIDDREPPSDVIVSDGDHGRGSRHYRRSVRCSADGAFRYVWTSSS